MDPEQLSLLEQTLALLNDLLARLGRLEAELARWREVLPDPESLRAKVARRRIGRAAVDMMSERS